MTPAHVVDDANGVLSPQENTSQTIAQNNTPEQFQKHWFVAYVGSRAEKAVRDFLTEKDFEAFAATQWEVHLWRNGRRKKIERPVITQYVFVNVTEKQRREIIEYPCIRSFLTNKATTVNDFGKHKPAIVPDDQMKLLKIMLAQSEEEVMFAPSGFTVGEKVAILGWGDGVVAEVVRIHNDRVRYIGVRIDQLGCAYMKVNPKLLIRQRRPTTSSSDIYHP